MLSNCIFVGLGGGAGAICRYLMGMLPILQRGAFPLATLTINHKNIHNFFHRNLFLNLL